MTRCPTCGGSGEIKHPAPAAAGKVPCPPCGGTGQVTDTTSVVTTGTSSTEGLPPAEAGEAPPSAPAAEGD